MRPEKQGSDRAKLAVGVLEEAIAEDAFVRVIDLFVDQLGDPTKLGFTLPSSRPKEKGGAPAYAHSSSKSWKLNLDWVEKAHFFLFSLLGAPCRLTEPQPQYFSFSRPVFLPDFYAVSRPWG